MAEPQFQVELSEAQFQAQVVDFAASAGWRWMHVPRSGIRGVGWRTQTSGPLGRGWLDLIMVKGRRLLIVELKAEKGSLSQDQKTVIEYLNCTDAEVYVWRPSQWAEIVETLTRDGVQSHNPVLG